MALLVEDAAFDQVIKPGIRTGLYVPIFPRRRTYLFAPDGGGRRFACLFKEAWKRIPLADRCLMLEYWRVGFFSSMCHPGTSSPRIDLVSNWNERGGGKGFRGHWGYTTSCGYDLKFFAPIVARMLDDVVQSLVAHELAHVYQYANDTDDDEFTSRELEHDAERQMEVWGFNSQAMVEWADKYPHLLRARVPAGHDR